MDRNRRCNPFFQKTKPSTAQRPNSITLIVDIASCEDIGFNPLF
jgi:hypothetical protein